MSTKWDIQIYIIFSVGHFWIYWGDKLNRKCSLVKKKANIGPVDFSLNQKPAVLQKVKLWLLSCQLFFECCKIWLWRNRWLVFRLSFSLRLPVYQLKLYDWVEIWLALNPLFTNRDNIGGDHCCVLKQPDARYRSPLLGFSSASNETPSPCSLLCGSP